MAPRRYPACLLIRTRFFSEKGEIQYRCDPPLPAPHSAPRPTTVARAVPRLRTCGWILSGAGYHSLAFSHLCAAPHSAPHPPLLPLHSHTAGARVLCVIVLIPTRHTKTRSRRACPNTQNCGDTGGAFAIAITHPIKHSSGSVDRQRVFSVCAYFSTLGHTDHVVVAVVAEKTTVCVETFEQAIAMFVSYASSLSINPSESVTCHKHSANQRLR
jgi:hypothetical protein